MKSESSRLTSRCVVRKRPSNGGYVLRQRLETSSSWTASASLRSTRTEKFNQTESSLIRRTFWRNCSNEHLSVVARSGPPGTQVFANRWPISDHLSLLCY